MNFLQLSYFKALADNGNLSQTANMLFISPPALSTSIAKLEKELGVLLFDRSGNRIYLNDNGRIFEKHVNAIFEELDAATKELNRNTDKSTSEIFVAITNYSSCLGLMSAFSKACPNISISSTVLRLDQLNAKDLISKYDFLITSPTDIQSDELIMDILYNDDYPCLMVYPDHPLANSKSIDLSSLQDEEFIALNQGYSSRTYYDKLFELAGFEPKIKMECDSLLRAKMVQQKLGISIITMRAAMETNTAGVVIIPIKTPKLPRTQAIFRHPKNKPNDAAKTFRKFAIDYFSKQ